jgi:hypothetical protein
LLVQAVLDALGWQRLAAEHPGEAHGVVGDIDHLLDLAVALCLDLADFKRDETA